MPPCEEARKELKKSRTTLCGTLNACGYGIYGRAADEGRTPLAITNTSTRQDRPLPRLARTCRSCVRVGCREDRAVLGLLQFRRRGHATKLWRLRAFIASDAEGSATASLVGLQHLGGTMRAISYTIIHAVDEVVNGALLYTLCEVAAWTTRWYRWWGRRRHRRGGRSRARHRARRWPHLCVRS